MNDTWSRRNVLIGGAMLAGLTAVPSLLSACSTKSNEETLKKIQDQGYVTVGFAGEPPYAFTAQGKLTGSAPAVHREIFKALNVGELRGKSVEFGSLIPGLNSGRFDVVTAGMFILPKRCQSVDFSEPEFSADTAFLVKSGNPRGITSYDDVANSSINLGIMSGAAEEGYARNAGVPEGRIKPVDTQQDGLDALVAGRTQAFALTSFSLRWLAKTNPDAGVEVTEPFVPTVDGKQQADYGGAVFRLEDDRLREAFNGELKKLRESGKLLELLQPFGFTERNIPPADVTTKKLCDR